MKICVVGSSKYFFSGITAHTIFLANALSKNNEVSVILLRKLLPRFLYPGKKHLNRSDYLIDFVRGIDIYEGMDWNSPMSWLRAYRFLRQHKPDAIIMLWWTSSVAHMQIFLMLANRLWVGAKLIIEMHETIDPLEERILPVKLYAKATGRLLVRSADALTAHSTSAKEQISLTYGIDKDRISVKPFGLYEDYKLDYDKDLARKELGIEEKFVILNFGSMRGYKGIPHLVKAFSALPEFVVANSRLVIAGEDWGDDDELGTLIESSPHRHKITFNPYFVPDDMIPKYFSAADVVVLPYLRSCGSAVASIAMAYGKAVITSDLETMRECFKEYRGASFSSVGNSSAISQELLQLYERHESGDSLPFNHAKNSWGEIVKQYELLIGQLMNMA
ncbi:MAG: D-inositol 3-phosphate glycosyltransferase [candidate division WS2 bacterium]|nr:D-inositol 3-phosphate glycosyltransferase [Candidatus Psychracetigena formicireducens]